MCGRFAQALPAEMLVRMFGAEDVRRESPAPSWNVAPDASVTVAAWDGARRRRVLTGMTWGLLAPWEKHWETARFRPINARCETIATSKMFAAAFRQRRCLVPVSGWYEWQKADGRKIPHAFGRSDGMPPVLGGIWECWRSPMGDRMLTLAIVTTPATGELTEIHARMPLVLEDVDWSVWLDETDGDPAALMRPAEPGRIGTWRIGRAVGNPANNGPELLQAAA